MLDYAVDALFQTDLQGMLDANNSTVLMISKQHALREVQSNLQAELNLELYDQSLYFSSQLSIVLNAVLQQRALAMIKLSQA